MKTLLLLFSFITAHAELPTNPDKLWLDRSGNKVRGDVSSSSEDREWMQDGRVRRLKQTREDREWMQDGRVRRDKEAREDRDWLLDGQIRRKRQAREDREWMQDGQVRRLKQVREDRDWTNEGPTKRSPVTQTAEIIEAPESVR